MLVAAMGMCVEQCLQSRGNTRNARDGAFKYFNFPVVFILLLQSLTLKLRLYSNKPPQEIAWGSKLPRRADQLQNQNEELAGCAD